MANQTNKKATTGEVKKRAGRPKKKVAEIPNENEALLTMEKKEKKEITVTQEVGKVSAIPDYVSLDDLQNRWRNVFGQYGGKMSFDQLTSAWNQSMNPGNNPFTQNRRVKQIITPAQKFTKDELSAMVDDAENNEENLRAISWYLYYTEYVFQNIVKLNREVPNFNYWYSPLYLEANGGDSVKKESVFVDKILKKFSPKLTFKTVATQCAVEGKCTYLTRLSYDKKDVNYMVLQKLNPNEVKIVGLGSRNRYIVAFNFAIFLRAGYFPSQYPQYIQDIWQSMIDGEMIVEDKKGQKKINPRAKLPEGYILESSPNGGWLFWATLPQDAAVTFYSDGAHNNSFGDMISLLEPFSTLSDYAWVQGQLASKGVNAIMTLEAPLTKDAKAGSDAVISSVDTILGYQSIFENNVAGNIMPFISPFTNAKLHELTTEPESMNIVSQRISQLVATSGLTGLITLSDKPNIASIRTSQKIQAAKNDYLTRQFEDWLNYIINSSFDLKNTWQVKLFGDIFTDEDTETKVKELVLNGANGLIPKLLAYHNLTLEDYKGSEEYLKSLGIEIKSNAQNLAEQTQKDNVKLAKTTANKTSSNTNSNPSKQKTGRKPLADGDVENDNTNASREQGGNDSYIK